MWECELREVYVRERERMSKRNNSLNEKEREGERALSLMQRN